MFNVQWASYITFPLGRTMVPHRNKSRGEAKSKKDIDKEEKLVNLQIKCIIVQLNDE